VHQNNAEAATDPYHKFEPTGSLPTKNLSALSGVAQAKFYPGALPKLPGEQANITQDSTPIYFSIVSP
jgi:hypothetical protein